MSNHSILSTVANAFCITGDAQHIAPLGNGHIHDTYLVNTSGPSAAKYVLQRINTHIFGDPYRLMHNIQCVTEHIRKKALDDSTAKQTHLRIIPCRDQALVHCDDNGEYWRLYAHIDGHGLDNLQSLQQAEQAGGAFGRFLADLSDLNPQLLHETLPQFHCLNHRLSQFEQALLEDLCHRKQHCINEVTFIRENAERMRQTQDLGEQHIIPLKVTHNDTKINNVLFNDQDQAMCVVDLDTVMPGYIHFDYSDAVRTLANTAAEDEADLSKVGFHFDFFASFCQAFIGMQRHQLCEAEVSSLAPATSLLPFTIGLRFLTDYLNGDTYFKTAYPEHNLTRARCQFQLSKAIDAALPRIADCIESSYLSSAGIQA